MAREKLLSDIHEYLYTRRINLETGQGYIENETIERLIRQAKIENKWILENIENSGGQFFNVLNYVNGHVGELKQNINMLSCLFPKRLIVTSFMIQDDWKYLLANIYNDYKEFIKAGLIDLYIETREQSAEWDLNNNNEFYPETIENSKIMLLTHSYSNINYEGIRILLPWLYNARTEDYLELIEKYDLQFDIYCRQIDKICKAAREPEELTQLFIKEVNDAFIDIRIALENKKEELFKKGINATIGSVVTAIPFLIPKEIGIISPEILSGILGATNVLATLPPVFGSVRDILKCEKFNEYWLLWKWNQISMK